LPEEAVLEVACGVEDQARRRVTESSKV